MAKAEKTVSPLAPAGGFPKLPVIDGVRYAAAEAGVRYAGRLDVMLATIDAGASVAGVFTRSATRSAPVLWCEACLARSLSGDSDGGYAVLVNSGNSNAFTGAVGQTAVTTTVTAAAQALGLPPEHVFVASTGVIGEPLPAERIVAVIDGLAAGLDSAGAEQAARAIMTTDTFPMGAMATMLVFLFTDAAVAGPVLQDTLSGINARTFNCITVDGDTSTSDSLVLAATGRSGMPPITEAGDPRLGVFAEALETVMRDLAQQVVRDGEGATKFVTVRVSGAESDADARKVALSIANSPLVKTAIAGEDPNWGRIVMAVGKSGAAADRDRLAIRFGDILVAEGGQVARSYREDAGAGYMKQPELEIGVDLGLGTGAATIWTCDLTHGYIAINADYRS